MPRPETAQFEFDFLLGTCRPLVRVEEARVMLHDCSAQHVHNLLEEGRILGLDIAGRGEERRCLRFWKYTVLHAAFRPEAPLALLAVGDLLPHARPTIRRAELAAWCGCAEATVAAWALPGPRTDTRSLYHRDAVIQFLTDRAV